MSRSKLMGPLVLLALTATVSIAAAQPAKHLDRHGDALPPGAMARMGTIRFRHDAAVGYVYFSPDGKTVLGDTFWERGSRLWHVASGKQVEQFRGKVLGHEPLF